MKQVSRGRCEENGGSLSPCDLEMECGWKEEARCQFCKTHPSLVPLAERGSRQSWEPGEAFTGKAELWKQKSSNKVTSESLSGRI